MARIRTAGARRFADQRTVRHRPRSEEHTSELQSQSNLVCRLLLEKKKAYAERQSVKEQVESVGATFVVLRLEAGTSADKGCHAHSRHAQLSLWPMPMATQSLL